MEDKDLKWHKRYMSMAKLVSTWSSCLGRQVGSVITVGRRVVSTGYNGAPPGIPSCKERGVCNRKLNNDHTLDSCLAVHAEQNSITWAAKHGISIAGGDIYTTTFPCVHCMRIIIASGIKRVFYFDDYPATQKLATDLANKAGVELIRMEE